MEAGAEVINGLPVVLFTENYFHIEGAVSSFLRSKSKAFRNQINIGFMHFAALLMHFYLHYFRSTHDFM